MPSTTVVFRIAAEHVGLAAADHIDLPGLKASNKIPGHQGTLSLLNPHDLDFRVLVKLVVEMRNVIDLDPDDFMRRLGNIKGNYPF